MSRPLKARLGWAGYAHLLARIKEAPGTLKTIARNADIGRDSIYRLVPDMHAIGLLHISDWSMLPGESTLPIYSFGRGEDAPAPALRPNGRPVLRAKVLRNARISPEVIAFGVFMRALEVPCTINEIVAACGCHRDTAKSAIFPLMAAGIVRIDHYSQRHGCGGVYMPNYTLGSERNATRPSRSAMRRATAKRWRDRVKRRTAAVPLLEVFGMATSSRALAAPNSSVFNQRA